MSFNRLATAGIVSAFGAGLVLGCNGLVLGEAADPGDIVVNEECTTLLMTTLVGQKGGTLKVPASSPLFGARLEIPPDALNKPAWVTLYAGKSPTTQASALSQTVCVGIAEQSEEARPVTLAKTAALVLPYDAARVSQITTERAKYLAIGEKTADSELPVPLPGLTVVDEKHSLLAAEIRHPGRYAAITRGSGQPARSPKVDVLFVLDNSGSMTPKQNALARHFVTQGGHDGFFKAISRYDVLAFKDCINYHVGITTTDVGRSAVESPEAGQLQTKTCHERGTSLGTQPAQDACNANCSPMIKGLPTGKTFIASEKKVDPVDQEKQFACMAIVGNGGSGEESPLESIRQTIATHRNKYMMPDDSSFLRPDSLTAIVILTDEDDCSMADGSRRSQFYSPTVACNQMDPSQPSCYADTNARCLGVSLECAPGDLLTTSGTKNGCKSRTVGATLTSATTYATDVKNFITLTGAGNLGKGLDTLYLFGAWPIAQGITDFQTTISFILDTANPPPSNTLGKQAFCHDDTTLMSAEPILGHPQVRLNEFALAINSNVTPPMMNPQITAASICSQGDRDHLLDALVKALDTVPMYCMMPLDP